jgi:hypothetical protein
VGTINNNSYDLISLTSVLMTIAGDSLPTIAVTTSAAAAAKPDMGLPMNVDVFDDDVEGSAGWLLPM